MDTVSLSKTTKLILLDSLLQEVCIKSGLAGLTFEFAQVESLSLSVTNLLYSGLKRVHYPQNKIYKDIQTACMMWTGFINPV